GGWGNWLEVTTVPQNNVYGATILAQDELSRQGLEKLKIKSDTLSWGKGFMGVDTCTQAMPGVPKALKDIDANNPLECKTRDSQTPGAVVESQLENALGSDMRRLEVANDINAILGAVANQLVAQVIKGGVGLFSTKSDSVKYSDAVKPNTNPDISSIVDSTVDTASADSNFNQTNPPSVAPATSGTISF